MSLEHLDAPQPAAAPTPRPRPAGLDALLNHVAAGLAAEEQHGPAPFGERHGPTPQEAGTLAVLDGRDALAFVVIRPVDGEPDALAVEAGSPHLSKAVMAYTLRQVAARMDKEAIAAGEEPLPYPVGELLAEMLEYLAAETRSDFPGPMANAYRAGIRVAARIARLHTPDPAPAEAARPTCPCGAPGGQCTPCCGSTPCPQLCSGCSTTPIAETTYERH
ncbi:hypothetical protein AB0H51_28005 [Streptomyces griseoluteus]|uniref:hypothetical protein n=1 Tax=Streptomyces griseoluteus TaxID=29306 RepID=UPI00340C795B